ncbi:MAG: methyltransferase family protein [Myxococcota bacterium]
MSLLLKNLVFTVLVPGTVAVYLPLWIARGGGPSSVWSAAPALLAFVVGGAVYAWCVWDFATFGRGTPAPIDAPSRLVARGLYRYTRNPMYVGVLTVLLGWVIWFQTAALVFYTLLAGTAFHLFVVLYEEPHLQREFGDSYASYRARVGRWLPRLERRRD